MKTSTSNKKQEVDIKPKEGGSPIINIVCAKCGAYFSERQGHKCNEDMDIY
jgi:formylmethanofuran dehydrogenase subunit E